MTKFTSNDIRKAMSKEPWVIDIARKPVVTLTKDDCIKVALLFCCKHWRLMPWEVTAEDVGDVLLEIQIII